MSEYLPVRLSHLMRHCSVGAIVRGPEYLMVVKDTREWTDRLKQVAARIIPYVEGVRSALSIGQELREPPIAKQRDDGVVIGTCIPAMRFPTWMHCPNPKCGFMYSEPWRTQAKGAPHCTQCKNKSVLEQMPWALIHQDGHMADVPWHFLLHQNARMPDQKQCRADWKVPYLQFEVDGPARKILSCTRCKVRADFSASARVPFGKTRQQPWVKDSPDGILELAQVLEINDARVHSPQTKSALVIPPESRIRKNTVVSRLYGSSQKRQKLDAARMPLARKSLLKQFASEFRCTVEDIVDAIGEIGKGFPMYGKTTTPGLLLESEYHALLDPIVGVMDDEDFVSKDYSKEFGALAVKMPVKSKSLTINRAVSRLIAVTRLKEVLVLCGFQRLGGKLVPPDIIGKSDWLPAIELYGEGIFFTLDEGVLSKWEREASVIARTADFRRRFEKSGMRTEPEIQISPRFLLLHTLAHALIRQLETEAGYPAASIKERIYCSAGKNPMAGILVYVAVPDVVGSLGGLVELVEPRRFQALLSSVFDHIEWCSFDPVCGEHEGQGPGLLNRAACHACELIPEPSCAYGNVLLDRTFIKGAGRDRMKPFLDFV